MLGLTTFTGLLLLLVVGSWKRPAVAFAAVLCLYGLKQWGQDTSLFLVEHRTVANFAAAILVGVGLLRIRRDEQSTRATSVPLPWVLGMALYLYALATLAWTPSLKAALDEWLKEGPYVAVIAFASPLLLRSHADVRQVCNWTILIGGTLCALALFLGHWGSRGLLLIGDVFEDETNPLALASLAGTVCVMAMLSIQHANWWRKLLYAVIVPIALATIVRSGSRGQLLAAGLALLVGWPLASSRRNFGAWLTLAVAGGVLYVVGSWILQHVDLNIGSSRWSALDSQEQVQGRLDMAAALLRQSIDNPASLVFGLGNSSAFYYVGFYPHIAAAEILGEEGLVGMAIYLSIIIATGVNVWRLICAPRDQADPVARHAYGVLAALFVFELILTMKEGTLLSSTYVFAYAAIVGRLVQRNSDASAMLTASLQPTELALPFPNLMK